MDSAHCTALKHEFLRCEDAFKDFETYGTLMILKAQAEATEAKGQPPTSAHEKRFIAYKTYNAYSRFILHLYEFMLGAVERDRKHWKVAREKGRSLHHEPSTAHSDRKASSDTEWNGSCLGEQHKLFS